MSIGAMRLKRGGHGLDAQVAFAPAFHWDASILEATTLVDYKVDSWTDNISNIAAVLPTTAIGTVATPKAPLLVKNIYTNRQVVRFSSSAQLRAAIVTDGPMTMFVVAKRNVSSDVCAVVSTAPGIGGTGLSLELQRTITAPTHSVTYDVQANGGAVTNVYANGQPASVGAWTTPADDLAIYEMSAIAPSNSTITINGYQDTLSGGCDVAEIMGYSGTPTVSEAAAIRAGLAAKWGISLGSTYTYAPSAPQYLCTTPLETALNLYWSRPVDLVGTSPATNYSYAIYIDNALVGTLAPGSSTPPATNYVVTGLTPGTSYNVQVATVVNGVESVRATITATTATAGSLYTGTSTGTNGARLSEMFGGDGNGSWANTAMPATTTSSPNETQAVADIVQCIYSYATGTDASPYGKVLAWPTLSYNTWSSSLNVINSATIPLVSITMVGSFVSQGWAQSTRAMLRAGIPMPAGLEPTNDTDGTIHLYDPDWKWRNNTSDSQYHGRIWELWGAKSPMQNYGAGDPARWTALHGGRFTGATTRKSARPRTLSSSVSTYPSYGAPSVVDKNFPTATTYWGFGPDGVAEYSTYMSSVSHIPMSHHIIRKSDLQNGVIKHPIGFSLYGIYPTSNKGPNVWPANGYDAASRTWMGQGSRFRLPANYVGAYPSGMPVEWQGLYDMFIACMRDYGMMFVDTTGSSFGIRGEPGLGEFLPAGFDSRRFIQYLPWSNLKMLSVGSDANYYP